MHPRCRMCGNQVHSVLYWTRKDRLETQSFPLRSEPSSPRDTKKVALPMRSEDIGLLFDAVLGCVIEGKRNDRNLRSNRNHSSTELIRHSTATFFPVIRESRLCMTYF